MKHRIKSIVVAIIMAMLVFTPIVTEDTYASTENATKVPVLVYHGIGTHDKGKLQISKSKLKKQLKWIKKCGYKTLTMEEFIGWYEGTITIPEKSVLITFDDGNKSVAKYALPMLRKNGQHATSFIEGNWVGRRGMMKKSTIRKLQRGSVIDIESHGYALHDRVKGKKPAKKWSQAKLKTDCDKMHIKYGCTALCYPWGATSRNLRAALEETGVYRVAFTYARPGEFQGRKNKYATRSDGKYTIPRITISARAPWTSIKKYIKP